MAHNAMSRVLESTKYVVDHAINVSVARHGCRGAAKLVLQDMRRQNYSMAKWVSHPLNPKDKTDATVAWIFTVDLLNFSFWSNRDDSDSGLAESQRYAVEYNGQHYTGYWSLAAAINRAIDNGVPITYPMFWASDDFTPDLLRAIFKSSTQEPIPMLHERYQVLKEAGEAFKQYGYTSFTELIAEAGNSAEDLVSIVSSRLPSFYDVSYYFGQEVYIMKRAQILVADIWACFEGQGYGHFTDIDRLSMFADYRVPQILHSMGCLKYSEALTRHIRSLQPLEHDDPREVELRTCSIWAVEIIRQEIAAMQQAEEYPSGVHLNAILVDFYLWDTAKRIQAAGKTPGSTNIIPCHRTRSIFY